MKASKKMIGIGAALFSMLSSSAAFAGENTDIAKKLANPIADMISVPFQYNYDSDIGAYDKGSRSTLNIQPVIPFSLNEDWNLISRTILPAIWQDDIAYDPISGIGTGSQSGFGSIVQSLFFSPKAPTADGWIWGAGPVFLVPTATNDLLGGDQWGAGPTAVGLKQDGHYTYGALANHIWSFAEDKNAKISRTFLQPFFAYITDDAVTYVLNTESTYDWESEDWSVPIHAMVSKVLKVGNQLISIQGGVRYWAVSDSPGTPEGWGVRAALVFIFPK